MSTKMTDLGSNVSNMTEILFTSTGTLTSTSSTAWGQIPVTITVSANGNSEDQEPVDQGSWESVLAVEGSPSSDRRYLIPTEIGERDLPLPLRVVTSDEGGHDNAQQVGRIESIQHIPIADFARVDDFNLADLPDSAIVVWGEGVFDGPPETVELAKTMIRNGAGVSLDLPHDRLALIDPDTFDEVPEDDIQMADVLSGKYLTGLAGKIAAATIVDIPAFSEATVRLRDGEAVVASAFGIHLREALVASVGVAPLAPPKEWFEMPEPDGPTPLTVTDDGRVFGHLATWNQCHASFPGSCELAPKSKSGYKFFHLGSLVTAEGESVPVGRITVGKPNSNLGGHNWDLLAGPKGAIEHYDRTGAVGAFVRAQDGRYGIWICGATRSDAPAEAIRDMRANPPSGDWRWENGGLELVAALSVPVPGFPVPYMMSSGGDHPHALIAIGYEEEEPKPLPTRAERRKMAVLTAQAREQLASAPVADSTQADQTIQDIPCPTCGVLISEDDATCPDCGADLLGEYAAKKKEKMMGGYGVEMTAEDVETLAVVEFDYNAEQRRAMAKNGEALPDGSFPIANCSDAEKAIHAQGRAQDQGKAVAHIKTRVKALGCSGTIFDNYK